MIVFFMWILTFVAGGILIYTWVAAGPPVTPSDILGCILGHLAFLAMFIGSLIITREVLES